MASWRITAKNWWSPRLPLLTSFMLAALVCGCGDDTSAEDSGVDVGVLDSSADTSGPDAGGSDTSVDAPVVDSGDDATDDATTDSGSDVGSDVGPDTEADAGPEGPIWREVSIADEDVDFFDVHWTGEFFLAAGARGDAGVVFRSATGESWAEIPFDPTAPFRSIASSDTTLLVVGTGNFRSSTDGLDWDVSNERSGNLWGMAFGLSRFVAVGEAGNIFSGAPGVFSRRPRPETITLYDVVFADGEFVAVGEDGYAVSSDDSLMWTRDPALPGAPTLRAVARSGDGYVAVGERGAVSIRSDDGTWESVDSGTTRRLSGLVLGSELLAVGEGAADRPAIVMTSADEGRIWEISDAGVEQPLLGVEFARPSGASPRYVAVGRAGTIVVTP